MKSVASHIVTKKEVLEVEALGFNISSGKLPFDEFLNQHFPGLQLNEYLKGINDLLMPLTEAKVEKDLTYFEDSPPMLIMQYCSNDEEDAETGLALSQALIQENDQIVAEIDFFRIPATARKKGIAKKLLDLNLQQYI